MFMGEPVNHSNRLPVLYCAFIVGDMIRKSAAAHPWPAVLSKQICSTFH